MTSPPPPSSPAGPAGGPPPTPPHTTPHDTPPTMPTAPRTTGAPPATGPAAPGRTRRTGRAIGFTLAAALLIFVTVVLVLFVVFNTQTVDISLVFGNVNAPLVLALVIAAVLGGLVVGLASLALAARRRSR